MRSKGSFVAPPTARPRSLEVAIEEPITREDRWLLERGTSPTAEQVFIERLKRRMAAKLADYIITHCQLMDDEDILRAQESIRFQCTINDMGAYTHWLPEERKTGRLEGFAVGYGKAIDQVYGN